MTERFQPTPAHAIFGQAPQEYECGEYIEAAMDYIDKELSRVMWNRRQTQYPSPFSNTGNKFECDVFKAHAYDWNEDNEQQFNFEWRDWRLSWYKYCGRGMSQNRVLSPDECALMLAECTAAVARLDTDETGVSAY